MLSIMEPIEKSQFVRDNIVICVQIMWASFVKFLIAQEIESHRTLAMEKWETSRSSKSK